MNSILNRQILSGNASLYSSVLGSMLVTLAILDRKFGVSGSLPVDVGGVLYLGCPFLCYLSISFVLPVVFERPIFMRPKPVLFRIAMAVFICFAAVVSWLVFIPVMW